MTIVNQTSCIAIFILQADMRGWVMGSVASMPIMGSRNLLWLTGSEELHMRGNFHRTSTDHWTKILLNFPIRVSWPSKGFLA